MPELPEVEMVARTLRARIVGLRVVAVRTSGLKLRREVDSAALGRAAIGATVGAVDRHGKYLVVRLSSAHSVVVHLGMSGRLVVERAGAAEAPHTHVGLSLSSGDELRYVDPRRFGVVAVYRDDALARARELDAAGVDPLTPAFTADWLRRELSTSGRDVKQFLLDQDRIAGLGNIYVAEALHLAGISPRRRADAIVGARAGRLHAAIVAVLEAGIANRGTSLRDYVDADGRSGGNQHHLRVYGRAGQACACGGIVRRLVQGGRSSFYCPRCQK